MLRAIRAGRASRSMAAAMQTPSKGRWPGGLGTGGAAGGRRSASIMADTTACVDVTCRGLRVAHRARFQPGPDGGGFVEHEAPLPVGTPPVILPDGQAPRA